MSTDNNDQPGAGDEDLSLDSEVVDEAVDENEDEGSELDPDDEDEQADETVEVDLDGKKYRLPADLKDRVWLHSDYTKKTQDIAEARRALDAEKAQVTETAKEITEGRAKVMVIDAQIEQLGKIDWEKLYESNPGRALQLQAQAQQLGQAKAALETELSKKTDEFKTQAEQAVQTRIREGNAILAKEIPGWGPKLVQDIGQFAMRELGYTPAELGQVTDHRVMRALYLAMSGKQVTSQKNRAKQHEQAQQSRPAASVPGKSAGVKDPRRMSTDEWMAHRNKQLAKKGR